MWKRLKLELQTCQASADPRRREILWLHRVRERIHPEGVPHHTWARGPMCVASAGRPSVRGITWRCTSVATLGRSPTSAQTAGRASAGGSICWCIAGRTQGRSPTPASVARVSAGTPTWQCTGVPILGRSPMAARCAASASARGSDWCDTRGSTLVRSPFSVRSVEKPFSIITNFLDILEFILARIIMNIKNVGSTLCVVETLKYIQEFTL